MTSVISIYSHNTTDASCLKRIFKRAGFEVIINTDVTDENLREVLNNQPEVVLIDLAINNFGGIDFCYQLKKEHAGSMFVIVFSDEQEDYIQVEAFKAGADDYIIKPISPRVILKRVEAMLRRATKSKDTQPKFLTYQNLEVDRDRYKVIQNGKELNFPRKEFEILFLLVSYPQKIFTREEIFQKVWRSKASNQRIIDVHIRKIRERIGKSSIKTIKGVGYQLS